MKITREVAIGILNDIGAEIAAELGYSQITYNDIDCGFWDMEHAGPLGVSEDGTVIEGWEKGAMSKWLTAKYGEMKEYKLHAPVPEGEKFKSTIRSGDYVGLRFMWGEPCLAVHKNGNSIMGELQLHAKRIDYEDGTGEYTDEYHVSGLHCFGEEGILWGNRLHEMWKKKTGDPKEFFSLARWNDEDIRYALENKHYEPTDRNVAIIREALVYDDNLRDRMIDAGWDLIYAMIEKLRPGKNE